MFPERLKRARKAAGLSMEALAEQAEVSRNAIWKYEHGEAMPASGKLLKLSKALDVRSEYFFRPVRQSLDGVAYRKHASLPKKVLDRVSHDVLEQVERWAELLDLFPDSVAPVAPFAPPDGLPRHLQDLGDIETFAEKIRDAWALGRGPIPKLIDVLESRGIIVVATDVVGDAKFDGLACSVQNNPVVVISSHRPGDRQRLTMAHELGHLLLHGRLAKGLDEEKACNRFAGAFLLPKSALVQAVGEKRHALDARELYLLKHEYGISMAAILMRCRQCGIISENLCARYFRQFGKQGWRKQEPGDAYPAEDTTRLRQLVYHALSEEFIGEAKAAELMAQPLARFHAERQLEEAGDGPADQ